MKNSNVASRTGNCRMVLQGKELSICFRVACLDEDDFHGNGRLRVIPRMLKPARRTTTEMKPAWAKTNDPSNGPRENPIVLDIARYPSMAVRRLGGTKSTSMV